MSVTAWVRLLCMAAAAGLAEWPAPKPPWVGVAIASLLIFASFLDKSAGRADPTIPLSQVGPPTTVTLLTPTPDQPEESPAPRVGPRGGVPLPGIHIAGDPS